jgi:hypothetical protein
MPAPCTSARTRAPVLGLGSCQLTLVAPSAAAWQKRRLRCVVAAAAPKRAEPKTARGVQRRKGAPAKGPEPDGPRWRFFDLEPYLFRWEVRGCACAAMR